MLHFSNNLLCCWSFVAGSLMRMNGLQSIGTDPLSHSHHPSNGSMLQRYKVTPLPQLFCLMRYQEMSTSSKVCGKGRGDKIFGILTLKYRYTFLSGSLSQYQIKWKMPLLYEIICTLKGRSDTHFTFMLSRSGGKKTLKRGVFLLFFCCCFFPKSSMTGWLNYSNTDFL